MWVITTGEERKFHCLWEKEEDAREYLKAIKDWDDYAELHKETPLDLATELSTLRVAALRDSWYRAIRKEWEDLRVEYYLPQDELDTMFKTKPERDWDRELDEFYVWAESKSYLTRVRDKYSTHYQWSYPE
jgi:hypothetical protein